MTTQTTSPITTGTSVLGMVYKDGVLLACDTLASYGSMAYWQKITRIAEVAPGTALAASGEFSDFQEAQDIIDDLARKDRCLADGFAHDTKQIWSYMSRVLYQMRNKMDPLYNSFLLAGMISDPEDETKKKPFLGQLDLFGTAFETKFTGTGYALHMAVPLMRAQWREGMTYDEARALMEECLKVLVYRDARASDRVQIANITNDGVDISEPFRLDTAGKWNCGEYAIHDPQY